jgi:hypothetical protein
MTAMPLKAGTLSPSRTQVNLKCDDCRHEWSIEMAPPVLIVRPDRQTDGEPSAGRPIGEEDRTDDRRNAHELNGQRMRVGLCGLLTSSDTTQNVAVLYSLDARRAAGRLRLLDPSSVFPPWLVPGSRLWLSAYDGGRLRIRISVVKRRREGCEDDEHFAEFAVEGSGGTAPAAPPA